MLERCTRRTLSLQALSPSSPRHFSAPGASVALTVSREPPGRPGGPSGCLQLSKVPQGNDGGLRETTFRERSRRKQGRLLRSRRGRHRSADMREDGGDRNLPDQLYQRVPMYKARRQS